MSGSSPSPAPRTDPRRAGVPASLAWALVAAAGLAAGAWVGGPDPGRSLAVAALVAAPVGALAAPTGDWRRTAAVGAGALLGMGVLVTLGPPTPRPLGALLALAGLLALGGGTATLRPRAAGTLAALLLLLGAAAAGAPAMAGWGASAPWPPEAAAWLLGIAPTTLVCESAGLDWMRSPAVYESVGTDRIGPELRLAHGALAGAGPLVVGCASMVVARAVRRAREPRPEQ